jgi:RecA/RadA recombinase
MPRKTAAAPKTKPKLTDIIAAKMKKKFGDDSISTSGGYGDIPGYLDTGIIALNYAIGAGKAGGLPMGRMTVLQGAEQASKTSDITKMGAMCQKRHGLFVYIDAEYKFDRKYAARLGLYDEETLPAAIARGDADEDTLPCMIIYPEHIQKVFQQLEVLIDEIREEDPNVEVLIAWDSVAATPSTAEFESDYDNNQPGSPARQMSAGLKKLCFKLARENVTLLAVNQEKEFIGFTANKNASKVATIAQRPLAFHCTVRIEVKSYGFVAAGGSGEDAKKEENSIGIKVAAKIAKNQCGPKGRVARFNLITIGPKLGPDNDRWILDFALDAKPAIVIKTGAYNHMRGSEDKWYAKDFTTSRDYDAVCKAVRAAMDVELAMRFEGFVPKEDPTAEDDDDGDDDTAPAQGSLTDAELEEFEKNGE